MGSLLVSYPDASSVLIELLFMSINVTRCRILLRGDHGHFDHTAKKLLKIFTLILRGVYGEYMHHVFYVINCIDLVCSCQSASRSVKVSMSLVIPCIYDPAHCPFQPGLICCGM